MKIQEKYKNKNLGALIAIAVRWCHKYIRARDNGKPCVSCNKYRTLEAGHFYSGGKYWLLKFDERNINGQCKQCNFYGSNEEGARYERELIDRIGKDEVEEIHRIAAINDRDGAKRDRFGVIEKILYYQAKCREIGAN